MSNYRALRQEIEQDLSDRITSDWLEEAEARDHDLTSGEVIGYESIKYLQTFVTISKI